MNRESHFSSSDTLLVVDRSKRRRNIIIAAVVVAALLLGAFIFYGRSKSQAAADAAAEGRGQIPTVSVIVPGTSQVGNIVTASGALAALRDQPVGIAGAGGRVVRVLVDAGSWVKAGQTLAIIDRSVQSQVAEQQQAQIASARAQAALAQSNYERALSLVSNGFVSKADLDAKRAARDAANAQVRVAQAQLGQTRAQMGQLNVIAPTGGLILSRNVELGQIVSSGSGALFRLAEGGAMEMRATLAQQDMAAIHVGMSASVTPIGSAQSYAGTVRLVSPVIDPQSRQGEVRISVPYNANIRPGGFAEAKIAAGQTTAPLLQQSAVLSDEKGNYVYIVDKDNKVQRRDVKVGAVSDAGVTIAGGLTGQETVVQSAGPFLNPGQKIAPKRKAAQ